jgi:hypothetical protein
VDRELATSLTTNRLHRGLQTGYIADRHMLQVSGDTQTASRRHR